MTAGVPILTNIISGWRLLVEIAWGADLTADPVSWTWEDVTTDVLQDNGSGVTITVGRGNGAQFAQPANCSLRLKNQNGAYTPASAVSFNYPFVRLGTPVRVSVSLNSGSAWSVRFQGEASSWSPGWDAQGNKAYVVLIASGSTRRLGQGDKPLRSPLERAIVAEGPLAYWPMEDGSTATQIASALPGHPAINEGGLQFASNTGLTGSAALPEFTDTASIVGPVVATPTASQWQWDWHYFMPGDPGVDTVVMQINTSGTITIWQYIVLNGGTTYQIKGYDNTGALAINRSFATLTSDPVSGAWSHWSFYVQDGGGGTVNYAFHYYPSLGGIGLADGGSFSGTPGKPTSWGVPPSAGLTGTSLGHVVLYDAYNYTQPGLPAFGYVGETADTRLTRLCTEEGVSLDIIGSSGTTMGPQTTDTFVNLLRECESADLGYLFDGIGPGLTYVCRTSLYDQAAQVTANANSGQVPATPAPAPISDDQRLANRITLTRTNGSFFVAEDEDGPLGTAALGVFSDRRVVNLEADGQLVGVTKWLLHLGTVEGMRYPQVPLDLAAAPELAASWVDAVPTSRVDLTNLGHRLPQHPGEDISLLTEGWTEFIASRQWRAAINSSNYRPWEVFKIGDSRLGRIQTGGSTVRSFATSTSTSIAVDNSSAGWSTAGLPFDVDIEGEQITVTAISGSTTPQTLTVTRSVNRVVKDHNTGAVVELWKPGVIAL